jgi:hypothetical protein
VCLKRQKQTEKNIYNLKLLIDEKLNKFMLKFMSRVGVEFHWTKQHMSIIKRWTFVVVVSSSSHICFASFCYLEQYTTKQNKKRLRIPWVETPKKSCLGVFIAQSTYNYHQTAATLHLHLLGLLINKKKSLLCHRRPNMLQKKIYKLNEKDLHIIYEYDECWDVEFFKLK